MAVSKRLRYEILRRDNHACRYCGAAAPDVKLNVDHVIPQALGGSDKPTNLVTSCADCNAGKTSSMPNATPVADVDQEAFRQAKEQQVRELSDHLWRGGYPPQWGREEVERHAVELAWSYAWSVASRGGEPTGDQYTEFLVRRNGLFETGHSIGEVICAAVQAGTQQTPHLSWGLGVADMQYVPISGEEYCRLYGVYDYWAQAWREIHGNEPPPERADECRGRLTLGVRDGHSRDELMQAARSAAFAGNADVDYFAYHIASESGAEKVGEL